jgi:hypothetical protein
VKRQTLLDGGLPFQLRFYECESAAIFANGELVVAFVFAAACVATTVTHLVAVEVFHVVDVMLGRWVIAMVGIWAVVPVIGMVVIVDVAVEVFRAMVPGACTDEDATAEPLRAVVTVGCTAVRSRVVVAIGAARRDTNSDADLGVCVGSICCKAETGDRGCCKDFKATHKFTSLCFREVMYARELAEIKFCRRQLGGLF